MQWDWRTVGNIDNFWQITKKTTLKKLAPFFGYFSNFHMFFVNFPAQKVADLPTVNSWPTSLLPMKVLGKVCHVFPYGLEVNRGLAVEYFRNGTSKSWADSSSKLDDFVWATIEKFHKSSLTQLLLRRRCSMWGGGNHQFFAIVQLLLCRHQLLGTSNLRTRSHQFFHVI